MKMYIDIIDRLIIDRLIIDRKLDRQINDR